MITTAPAAPALWVRARRAVATAALIPVFLGALALDLLDRPMTWPRAIACAALGTTAAAIVVWAWTR